MKKILLAAAGMTGLLASCGGGSDIMPGYYSGAGRSSTLSLQSVSNYITSWKLTNAVQDQNGNTIPANSYVICDNRSTDVSVDVRWTGAVSRIGIQFKGLKTGDYRNVYAAPYTGTSTSVFGTVNYTLNPYAAPLSIGTQAITVNPVTKVTVKGATYINAQALDTSGLASNVVTTPNAIPVMDCF